MAVQHYTDKGYQGTIEFGSNRESNESSDSSELATAPAVSAEVVEEERQQPKADLRKSLVLQIRQCHLEINHFMSEALSKAQICGNSLKLLKDELPHGEFIPWVESTCGISKRTAQGYMKIATEWERLPKSKKGLGVKEALHLLATTRAAKGDSQPKAQPIALLPEAQSQVTEVEAAEEVETSFDEARVTELEAENAQLRQQPGRFFDKPVNFDQLPEINKTVISQLDTVFSDKVSVIKLKELAETLKVDTNCSNDMLRRGIYKVLRQKIVVLTFYSTSEKTSTACTKDKSEYVEQT